MTTYPLVTDHKPSNSIGDSTVTDDDNEDEEIDVTSSDDDSCQPMDLSTTGQKSSVVYKNVVDRHVTVVKASNGKPSRIFSCSTCSKGELVDEMNDYLNAN